MLTLILVLVAIGNFGLGWLCRRGTETDRPSGFVRLTWDIGFEADFERFPATIVTPNGDTAKLDYSPSPSGDQIRLVLSNGRIQYLDGPAALFTFPCGATCTFRIGRKE